MLYRILIKVAALAVCLSSVVAQASEARVEGATVNRVIGFGLTYGGEKLAEAQVEYDGHTIDEDLRGGDLITVAAGFVTYLPQREWSFQTTIGYHLDEVSADNGDIRFERYPLEFIPFYNSGNYRVGAGLSYHLSPKLNLRDIGGPKVAFDNALGWLVEYDYSFVGWRKAGLLVGVRYLWIDYKIDKINGTPASGENIDGSHFGVHADFMF